MPTQPKKNGNGDKNKSKFTDKNLGKAAGGKQEWGHHSSDPHAGKGVDGRRPAPKEGNAANVWGKPSGTK